MTIAIKSHAASHYMLQATDQQSTKQLHFISNAEPEQD